MGMCTSVYIVLDKLDELLGDIEGVKSYINHILVLSQDSLKMHIEQLRMIFRRLQTAGLIVMLLSEVFG